MFIPLLDEDFLENQLEEFLEEQEESGGTLQQEDEFIIKLQNIIHENIDDEYFGIPELSLLF